MSKPWFLQMALEQEPSPLAQQISSILKPSSAKVDPGVDQLAKGIAILASPENEARRPDAADEI